MSKSKKLRVGDLVLISTPSFYSSRLDDNLESKTGVIMRIVDAVLPAEPLGYSKPIYDVLIEGEIVFFYNNRYMSRL